MHVLGRLTKVTSGDVDTLRAVLLKTAVVDQD